MSKQNDAINLYPCRELACLQISGQDSTTFLQSQLTQDVQLLKQQRAALAGYCSVQGRLLASMILVPTDDEQCTLVIVSSDLVESLVKRLRMFVLRSKVVFDVRTDLQVHGMTIQADHDDTATDALNLPKTVWATHQNASTHVIRAPSESSELKRYWVISDQNDDSQFPFSGATQHESPRDWHTQDIKAGLPWIQDATKDLLIPQSVNFDLIDGVSFKKGCFPGQEVVARMHYRAKVKRRMHAGKVTPVLPDINPAADIFTSDNPDSPCGRIIQVSHDDQSSYVLFEALFKAVEGSELRVMSAEGPSIEIIQLPYATQEPS